MYKKFDGDWTCVVQEICAWRQTRPDAGRVKPGNNLQHRSSEYWLLNLASVLAVGESWYTYDVMHIALSNLNQNGWLLGSDLDYYCLIVLLYAAVYAHCRAESHHRLICLKNIEYAARVLTMQTKQPGIKACTCSCPEIKRAKQNNLQE